MVKRSEKVIVVPDLSPVDLVTLAEKRIGLAYVRPDFVTWDFCQYRVEDGQPSRFLEVRGKRYEVLIWKPGESVTTQQVRDYFQGLGADGNTAAFIAWLMETKPAGFHVSIPSDDALLFRDADGCLRAPYGDCGGDLRELSLDRVNRDWRGSWIFVAFREVSS